MRNDADEEGEYADIIDLPHHQSKKHSHMPLADRAAQFSPFAALTGHSDAVKETARLTEAKVELNDEAKTFLNARVLYLAENMMECPEASITFFVPDERKAGGAYITKTGAVKRIDEYERAIVMADDAVIRIDDIVAIEGAVFDHME